MGQIVYRNNWLLLIGIPKTDGICTRTNIPNLTQKLGASPLIWQLRVHRNRTYIYFIVDTAPTALCWGNKTNSEGTLVRSSRLPGIY